MSEMPLRFVQAEQLAGDGTHGAHPAGTDAAGLTGLKERAGNTSKEEGTGMVWEEPVFLDVDITVSEICTLLHVAGLFPTTTTMDNSVSGTCSINGLIAVLAVV